MTINFIPEQQDMSTQTETRTWPELAIGLYDKLTERNARIDYRFENFEVAIPSSAESKAEHARWQLNGTLQITTSNGDH